MGNYYQGYIELFLKKDIPNKIKDTLLNMKYYDTKDSLKPLNTDFFKKENWKDVVVQFDMAMNIEGEHFDEYNDIEKEYMKKAEKFDVDNNSDVVNFLKELLNNDIVKNNTLKYIVRANCTIKGYDKELESLVDWLRPYLIENHPEKIGYIEDEDGNCRRTIYLDKDLFQKTQEERLFICKGCEEQSVNVECENWEFCKRAYNLNHKPVEKYLVVLNGQGDTNISLVNKDIWDWLINEDLSVDIPVEIAQYETKWRIKLNRIRSINDKAFILPEEGNNGEKVFFSSVKNCMNYVRENNIVILDEYDGYIY